MVGPAENSLFVNHTIPATMGVGQGLFVGLTWRNTGEGVWSTLCLDHALAVTFADCAMASAPAGAGGDALVLIPMPGDAATPPGQSHQFIARLNAPAQPGQCTIRFQMSRGPGQGQTPGPMPGAVGAEPGQTQGAPVTLFGPEQEVTVQIVIPPNAAREWESYE
jgi:hypothetical protein